MIEKCAGAFALLLAVSACASNVQGSKSAQSRNGLERMLMGMGPLELAQIEKIATEAQKFPLGTAKNPVRAEMPQGQRAYIARLRCADGQPPQILGRGNVGAGIYGSIVDVYSVSCGAAQPGQVEIHMDMYHPGYVENAPVPGFTIVTP